MTFTSVDLKAYAQAIYNEFWLPCPADGIMQDCARVLVELCEELAEFAEEPSLAEAGDVLFFVALADKMFMLNLEPAQLPVLQSEAEDPDFVVWAVKDICGGLKRLARPGDNLARATDSIIAGVQLALRILLTYCWFEGISLADVAEANVEKLRKRKQANTLAGIGSDR